MLVLILKIFACGAYKKAKTYVKIRLQRDKIPLYERVKLKNFRLRRSYRAGGARRRREKIECFVPINGILKGETRRRRENLLGVFCTYNVIFKVETRRRREIFLGVLSLHIGFQRGNAPKARKILGVFVLINWIFKGENASKARKNWMFISPPSTKS